MKDCCSTMLAQQRDGWKKWLTEGTYNGVEVTSKKVASDGNSALILWRCWVDVDAPPSELLARILKCDLSLHSHTYLATKS